MVELPRRSETADRAAHIPSRRRDRGPELIVLVRLPRHLADQPHQPTGKPA